MMRRDEQHVTWDRDLVLELLGGDLRDLEPMTSVEAFIVRARSRLHSVEEVPSLRIPSTTPSAVLVPIFFEAGSLDPMVWLVRKTDGLRVHSGQVALPGGKSEPHDGNLLETALREAREEVGLDAAAVEVLGAGDPFPTMTGFVITPFVGLVRKPFEPVADTIEVARVFAARLATFRTDGEMREVRVRGWRGVVPTYEVDGEIVWGATAKVLCSVAAHLVD